MIIFAADTHPGRVREYNEDCYLSDPNAGLWLVADGVGGHTDGELASAITSEVTTETFRRTRDLVGAIHKAHAAVLEAIAEKNGASNMGSTIVAIAFNGMDYQIAWVGDSRAYLWNGDLRLLTRDQSYVEALIDKGAITPEQALHHPKRNVITQCIGITAKEGLKVDSLSGTLAAGECIVLCSDGLNDELDQTQLTAILARSSTPKNQVAALLQAALDAGGRDNITVLIVAAQPDSTPGNNDVSAPQNSAPVSSAPLSRADMTMVQTVPLFDTRQTGLLAAHRGKMALLATVVVVALVLATLLWAV